MTSFSATPAGTAAGSNQDLNIDAKFDANPTSMTLNFPPGLWASIAGGPNTTVATGSISLTGLGTANATLTPSGTTPAGAPPDCGSNPVSKPTDCTLTPLNMKVTYASLVTLNEAGYVVLHPATASLEIVFPNITTDGLPITINEISLKMLGMTSAGSGARLPSSNSAATITASSDPAGSGSSTFTPTGTPAYTPTLGPASVNVNSAGQAQVNVDISQPGGQAGTNAEQLVIPGDVLSVSPGAIQDLVNHPSGVQVGTVSLNTPLLPAGDQRTNGTFTLSGTPEAPVVTVAFPGLGGLSFSGNIIASTIGTNPTVQFHDIPDVPFTDLKVSMNASDTGLFNAACGGTHTDDISSTFTSWWNPLTSGPSNSTISATGPACPAGDTGDLSSPFGINTPTPGPGPSSSSSGTPATTATANPSPATGSAGTASSTAPKPVAAKPTATIGKPTLSKLTLTGAAKNKPRLAFRLTRGKGAYGISAFSVNVPGALSYVTKNFKKDLVFHGAQVKSVNVSHGKLVVELKKRVNSVGVVLGIGSLRETRQLLTSVRKHKAKSLNFLTAVRANKTLTSLRAKITKFS